MTGYRAACVISCRSGFMFQVWVLFQWEIEISTSSGFRSYLDTNDFASLQKLLNISEESENLYTLHEFKTSQICFSPDLKIKCH